MRDFFIAGSLYIHVQCYNEVQTIARGSGARNAIHSHLEKRQPTEVDVQLIGEGLIKAQGSNTVTKRGIPDRFVDIDNSCHNGQAVDLAKCVVHCVYISTDWRSRWVLCFSWSMSSVCTFRSYCYQSNTCNGKSILSEEKYRSHISFVCIIACTFIDILFMMRILISFI